MATEFAAPSISVTKVRAMLAILVAFLLGVVLVATIALSTGWRSSDETPSRAVPTSSPAGASVVDCYVNRLC